MQLKKLLISLAACAMLFTTGSYAQEDNKNVTEIKSSAAPHAGQVKSIQGRLVALKLSHNDKHGADINFIDINYKNYIVSLPLDTEWNWKVFDLLKDSFLNNTYVNMNIIVEAGKANKFYSLEYQVPPLNDAKDPRPGPYQVVKITHLEVDEHKAVCKLYYKGTAGQEESKVWDCAVPIGKTMFDTALHGLALKNQFNTFIQFDEHVLRYIGLQSLTTQTNK